MKHALFTEFSCADDLLPDSLRYDVAAALDLDSLESRNGVIKAKPYIELTTLRLDLTLQCHFHTGGVNFDVENPDDPDKKLYGCVLARNSFDPRTLKQYLYFRDEAMRNPHVLFQEAYGKERKRVHDLLGQIALAKLTSRGLNFEDMSGAHKAMREVVNLWFGILEARKLKPEARTVSAPENVPPSATPACN
ncbi:MAG TPA: hypothetical protein VFR09_04855 [Alphaproteobacteria bacterium]|nr:hypothetical protein [Alphaproteobacteria bacterium]